MKIIVTSISWQGVSEIVRSITREMENALSLSFKDLSYGAGIDQLTIVIISASSEDSENKRLSKGYNRVGRVRHPFTKEPIKFIGFAIPINSDLLVSICRPELGKLICEATLDKIANPKLRLPKDFDYDGFSKRLRATIETFSHAFAS
jgi:hypothetical protein